MQKVVQRCAWPGEDKLYVAIQAGHIAFDTLGRLIPGRG